MTPQRLTIVVTCTDRKAVPVPADLSLRNLPAGSASGRVAEWRRRLGARHSLSRPLRHLYQGEAWAQVRNLEAAARDAGFEPSTWVVSAGLGAKSVDEASPPYSATFTTSHADSVGAGLRSARAWWCALTSDGLPTKLREGLAGPTLMVLSETYSRVVAPTLLLQPTSPQLLVVGGSAEVPDHARLRSDLSLRDALGGTAMGLNMRMAVAWMRRSRNGQVVAEDARVAWNVWAERVRVVKTYDRTPLSDDALREVIATALRRDPDLSKTRALAVLRSKGLACEQRRFGRLFTQVAGAG